jgi:hypothetical protein
MTIKFHIIRDGAVVETDALTAGRWMEDNPRARQIGYHEIIDPADGAIVASVSTVLLGMSMDPPSPCSTLRLFETMVFGGRLDRQQWRYDTLDEAKQGHAFVLALVHDLPPLPSLE